MPDAPAIPPSRRSCSLALVLSSALLGLSACGGGGGEGGAEAAGDTAGLSPSTAGGGSGLVALDARTSCALPDFRRDLLQQINTARAVARSCGATVMPAAPPLAWNDRLFSAAARHSEDMAVNDYFSHTGLDGRSSAQRVAAEGYAWSWVGENIAAGPPSVSQVMKGWLASPGHCANIMRAEYSEVGVSCVQRSGSTYGQYWTMALARPR
jgi:uncharacterized protein YkwD